MTTYVPIESKQLFSLALAKARGRTWTEISEQNRLPIDQLEMMLWQQRKEWARLSRYAEKLVAHDLLSETIATLRADMRTPTTPARLKAPLANSLVRIVQLQQVLHRPKRPLMAAKPQPASPPLAPMPDPIPLQPAPLPTRGAGETVTVPASSVPKSDPKTSTHSRPSAPFASVVATLLLVLLGLWGQNRWCDTIGYDHVSVAMIPHVADTERSVLPVASMIYHSTNLKMFMPCGDDSETDRFVQQCFDCRAMGERVGLPPPEV